MKYASSARHLRADEANLPEGVRAPDAFRDIAEEFSRVIQKRVSYQYCQQLCHRAEEKFLRGVMKDETIRRMARQHGLA